MKRFTSRLLLITAQSAAALLLEFAPAAYGAVSFSKDVAPILQQKCLTCHGPDKAKGGYRLDTFSELLKAGDSGKNPVIAGDPAKSLLFELLVTADEDDRMPQKADPLSSSQIQIIRKWIAEGAKFDGPDEKTPLALLTPRGPRATPPIRYPFAPPILALAFSADGKRLATSAYHEALIWQTNGANIQRIGDLPERVHGLAFTAHGLAVAGGTPGLSGELLLANLEGGDAPRVLLRIADEMVCLAVNKAGDLLAAGGADNSIHLFELPSGREVRTLQQHSDWVTALAFSIDGSRLASASRDRTARIFDPGNGNLLETYAEHSQALFAVAFAGDKKSAISGGRERNAHFWTVAEGKKAAELPVTGGNITDLMTIRERTFAATGAGEIVVFKGRKLERTFKAHKDWVHSLAGHADTGTLASGSHDGEVRLWNLETGESVGGFIAAP